MADLAPVPSGPHPPGRDLALRPAVIYGDARLPCIHVEPRDPNKPTIVLLHGWVMNRSAWCDAVAPLVAQGYGVWMPDLPGHGEAPAMPPVRNKDVYDAMADRVALAMEAAGLPPSPVAGYSMGGTVALALARRRPDLATALFLLDPIVRFPILQMLFARPRLHARFFANGLRALFSRRGGAFLRAVVGLTTAGMYMPVALKRLLLKPFLFRRDEAPWSYVGCRRACDVEIFLDGFTRTEFLVTAATLEAKFRTNYSDVFSTFAGPLHLATGSEDAFVPPAYVRAVARRGLLGPRARAHAVSIIDGHDHLSVCTAPDEVSRLLAVWLADVDATRPRALPAAS